MPISISCSKCHRKFEVRDELAGKVAKCPCGEKLAIPAAMAAPSDLAPLPDAQDLFADAPDDPFAGIVEAPGSEAAPLQPLAKRRKSGSWPKAITPRLIVTLAGSVVGCLLTGGLIFLGIRLLGPTPPRWNTPEEVFAAWKQARSQGDRRLYFETQSPRQQDAIAEHVVGVVTVGAIDCPAFAEVCRNHGITPADLESVRGDIPKLQELDRGLHDKIGRMSHSQKAALFAEGVEILTDDSRLPDRVPRTVYRAMDYWQGRRQPMDDHRLADVRIEGDVAKACRGRPRRDDPTKMEVGFPIEFVKVNGEWRIGPAESKKESQ